MDTQVAEQFATPSDNQPKEHGYFLGPKKKKKVYDVESSVYLNCGGIIHSHRTVVMKLNIFVYYFMEIKQSILH